MRSSDQFNIQHCVYDAKPWAIRFMWIQITMSYYQRLRILLMQFTKQRSQRTLLSLRSGVARSLAVTGKGSVEI